ncbi:MAG: hypothetical protein IT318_01435 [Anaerolineales bacterium]|nr:hypothetical protein [Anaerolineales bacterium]
MTRTGPPGPAVNVAEGAAVGVAVAGAGLAAGLAVASGSVEKGVGLGVLTPPQAAKRAASSATAQRRILRRGTAVLYRNDWGIAGCEDIPASGLVIPAHTVAAERGRRLAVDVFRWECCHAENPGGPGMFEDPRTGRLQRDDVDLDPLGQRLLGAARGVLEPEQAWLWLPAKDRGRDSGRLSSPAPALRFLTSPYPPPTIHLAPLRFALARQAARQRCPFQPFALAPIRIHPLTDLLTHLSFEELPCLISFSAARCATSTRTSTS